jgi:hypothetical protein
MMGRSSVQTDNNGSDKQTTFTPCCVVRKAANRWHEQERRKRRLKISARQKKPRKEFPQSFSFYSSSNILRKTPYYVNHIKTPIRTFWNEKVIHDPCVHQIYLAQT